MGSIQFSALLAFDICVWMHISSGHKADGQNKNIFWLNKYQKRLAKEVFEFQRLNN